MPYVFTKTEDYVKVQHAIDNFLLTTRERGTVVRTTSGISIMLGVYQLNCPVSDIGTIDGVTPVDANDAAVLLGKLFKGYPPFTICN